MAEVEITWLNNQSTHLNRSWKAYGIVREEAVLTNSYVDSDYIDLGEFDRIDIGFNVTPVALTQLDYKIYGSYDGTTWYNTVSEVVASGSILEVPCEYHTPLASGMEPWHVSMPFSHQYAKVAVKGVGTATNSLCEVVIGGSY